MPALSWNPFNKNGLPSQIFNKSKEFMLGTPETRENVSTLRPEQEPLFNQAINAGMNPGAGGAFGTSADYYRDLLSNDSQTMNQLSAPETRRFNEQTIPDISEQFAGMGSGGLSSSGFQNAAIGAGTDLSERLGAIRASLRQQGAQGLQNIGQTGLGNYSQNMTTQPGSEGFLSQVAPAIGTGIGTAIGGGIGNVGGKWLKNSFGQDKVGSNSSPYGQSPVSSPQIPQRQSGFNLPNRSF
jgi:hypothetical protein